ncbi:hypothetical protein BU26DRAFT_1734 [Trematosphaeria pertusa]|uniref:Uncharacterized protein n=1 Tax=Trematosphaeria pertusa TaxID=390896 RepID=A0A6A6J0Z4_9PLEO|nr:uncharacterized protein BU26DRAFT_1734 [Trematosphaeria pertusa]KAF2255540.1 hypothetical protein BU26DRAFT_1734 [Trematosphaeria pertusa]
MSNRALLPLPAKATPNHLSSSIPEYSRHGPFYASDLKRGLVVCPPKSKFSVRDNGKSMQSSRIARSDGTRVVTRGMVRLTPDWAAATLARERLGREVGIPGLRFERSSRGGVDGQVARAEGSKKRVSFPPPSARPSHFSSYSSISPRKRQSFASYRF